MRLGIECVTQSMDLEINIERAKYREIPSDKEDKYYVKNGDLFICRQNGNLHFVGKAKYYRGPDNKFIFSDSLIQLRPDKKLINSEFFSLIMSSMKVRNQLEKFCSTTAGNFSINGTNLKKVKVNVPTLNNQKAIVEKVNSLMALCDELEKQIETSQIQIEQLMQSCLKEVFESDLKTEKNGISS